MARRRGAEVLIDRIWTLMKSRRWFDSEHETIRLTPVSPEKTGAALRPHGLLHCHVSCTRTGVPCKPSFNICLRIDPHEPPEGVPLDYTIVIARGLLAEADFNAFAEAVQSQAGAESPAAELLEVGPVRVRCGGVEIEYALDRDRMIRGAGYAVFPFVDAAGALAAMKDRPAEFRLEASHVINRSQGWYRYFTASTILGELSVELESPFPTRANPGWWWQEPDVAHGWAGRKRYNSKVTVRGPVLPGSCIDWVFDQETNHGQEAGE
jgi:hypothetical protein